MTRLIKSEYRMVRIFLEEEYIEEILEYEMEALEFIKRDKKIIF